MTTRIDRDNLTHARDNLPMSSVTLQFIGDNYRPLRNAPKLLARLTGASPRTASKWLRGETDPSLRAVIELARNDQEFRAHLISAMGGE